MLHTMTTTPQPYWTEEAAQVIHAVTAPGDALDLLQAWIARDPHHRCVDRMARHDGRFLVEIRSRSGVHETGTQTTLEAAIRTCLMVALWDGER